MGDTQNLDFGGMTPKKNPAIADDPMNGMYPTQVGTQNQPNQWQIPGISMPSPAQQPMGAFGAPQGGPQPGATDTSGMAPSSPFVMNGGQPYTSGGQFVNQMAQQPGAQQPNINIQQASSPYQIGGMITSGQGQASPGSAITTVNGVKMPQYVANMQGSQGAYGGLTPQQQQWLTQPRGQDALDAAQGDYSKVNFGEFNNPTQTPTMTQYGFPQRTPAERDAMPIEQQIAEHLYVQGDPNNKGYGGTPGVDPTNGAAPSFLQNGQGNGYNAQQDARGQLTAQGYGGMNVDQMGNWSNGGGGGAATYGARTGQMALGQPQGGGVNQPQFNAPGMGGPQMGGPQSGFHPANNGSPYQISNEITRGGQGVAGGQGQSAANSWGTFNPGYNPPYTPPGITQLNHDALNGDIFSAPTSSGDYGALRQQLQKYLQGNMGGMVAQAPGDVSSAGTGTQSVDQLGGVNSSFFNNMVNQLQPAFDSQRARALSQAKEATGNLTGSSLQNYLGEAMNRSLAQQNETLANYATQGLGMENQRQMAGAGLANQRNLTGYGTNADINNANAGRFSGLLGGLGSAGVGANEIISQGGMGALAGPLGGLLGQYLAGRNGGSGSSGLGDLGGLFGGGSSDNPPDQVLGGLSGAGIIGDLGKSLLKKVGPAAGYQASDWLAKQIGGGGKNKGIGQEIGNIGKGAAIGSVIPGVGTLIGAGVGAAYNPAKKAASWLGKRLGIG